MCADSKIGMVLAGFSGMLRAMKPLKNCPILLIMGVLAGHAVQTARAETRANPYQAIIERNPFGLKPPPPPQEVVAPPPPVLQGKVILTGISSLFGVRALLEITEQEPGKSPTTRKPILKEGERDGSIEEAERLFERRATHQSEVYMRVPELVPEVGVLGVAPCRFIQRGEQPRLMFPPRRILR